MLVQGLRPTREPGASGNLVTYAAVLFDPDGVLTPTTATHAGGLALTLGQHAPATPDGKWASETTFGTQPEGRPDVVGGIGNSRHVILEGRFWASLTDSQPIGYLDSMVLALVNRPGGQRGAGDGAFARSASPRGPPRR